MGQSISVAHLAPFVDVSRQKIIKDIKETASITGLNIEPDQFNYMVERRLRKEVEAGVQTIQYQVVTLMTTNGQAPFITVFMYLNEAKNEQEKKDIALIIEEMLKQRYQGVKNEAGAWISPAFPKLIYVLENDNIHEDDKYFYLTEMAAKCTARRMVPDYISEKKMLELKIDEKGEGHCYPCMGAVLGESKVKWYQKPETMKFTDVIYRETSIEEMWNLLSENNEVENQFNLDKNPNKDMRLNDVYIFDNNLKKYVKCNMMNRNLASKWYQVTFTIESNCDKIYIICTDDHPWTIYSTLISNPIDVQTKDLRSYIGYCTHYKIDDVVIISDVHEVQINDTYAYDVTTESEHFEVDGVYSHNCRSFLTPYRDENGNPKYYGRFNQGVITINLIDVALSSGGDFDKFWKIFDDRLENLCHRALRLRHERLLGTLSDNAPIVWQNGGYARLKQGEKIDKLLYGGYSTISLGYAGVYEMTKYMTGVSHTDPKGKPFALEVMKRLNDYTMKWRKAENIHYSLYGTPIESTTYKFAKCLKKRFGVIPGITDRNYITNSYHVPVFEKIDAFTKLSFESEFQELSPGGAISYVEVPNMQNNIPAIIAVLKHIYENIMYAELNTKSDYCQECGYDGEIQIKEDENKKLYWCCPKCGNTNQKTMNIARRTCGLTL